MRDGSDIFEAGLRDWRGLGVSEHEIHREPGGVAHQGEAFRDPVPEVRNGPHRLAWDPGAADSNRADRLEAGHHRGPCAAMPVSGVRGVFRLLPPFAPRGRSYTHSLERLMRRRAGSIFLKTRKKGLTELLMKSPAGHFVTEEELSQRDRMIFQTALPLPQFFDIPSNCFKLAKARDFLETQPELRPLRLWKPQICPKPSSPPGICRRPNRCKSFWTERMRLSKATQTGEIPKSIPLLRGFRRIFLAFASLGQAEMFMLRATRIMSFPL